MHINLLNSNRFYSSNKVYHKFQEIYLFWSHFLYKLLLDFTESDDRCVDFTEIQDRLHFFFLYFETGEKVSLNILRRVFLILRGKSQYSKVTKQWVWKPIKVEKERSYLQPTVRDVIAMRKTSAMYPPLPDIPSLPRNIVPIESPSISTLKQVRSRFSSDHSKSTLQIKTAIFIATY